MTPKAFLVIWIIIFSLCAVLFQVGFAFLMYSLSKIAALQIKWKRNDKIKHTYYTENLYSNWLFFLKLLGDEVFLDDHTTIRKIYATLRIAGILLLFSITCFFIAAYMQR